MWNLSVLPSIDEVPSKPSYLCVFLCPPQNLGGIGTSGGAASLGPGARLGVARGRGGASHARRLGPVEELGKHQDGSLPGLPMIKEMYKDFDSVYPSPRYFAT